MGQSRERPLSATMARCLAPMGDEFQFFTGVLDDAAWALARRGLTEGKLMRSGFSPRTNVHSMHRAYRVTDAGRAALRKHTHKPTEAQERAAARRLEYAFQKGRR